jgi:hypothetical protein
MKSFLSTACAVAALAMAGSAFAEGAVKVTLESPVAGQVKLIAAHAVFRCQDTTCEAALAPDDANGVYACADLAKKVGRVTSYVEFKALDDKALAKCNAAAPKGATVTAQAH